MRTAGNRKKKSTVAGALILLGICGVLGYLWSSHARANRPEPELVEVACYGNVNTAYGLRVCIQERTVRVMRVDRERGYRRELRQYEISEAQMNRFSELVKSTPSLRRFTPRSRWFGECRYPEPGGILVFVWSDKTRAYAMPQEHMRMNAPEYAKGLYDRMDQIGRESVHLPQGKQGKITVLHESDPLYKEHLTRRSEAYKISLPKNRVGW